MSSVHTSIAAIILSGSLVAPGDSFASTCDEVPFTRDYLSEADYIDAEEDEAEAVHRLENEMQMSIDPTDALKGVRPDYSCTREPYDCPTNQVCPLASGASSSCLIAGCGLGECSACPVKTPGLIITR